MKTLAIIMDPIEQIHYQKDTSMALLWAARDCGFQLYYLQQMDMFLDDGIAKGKVTELSVYNDSNHWFDRGDQHTLKLGDIDVILMRKDPPFNMQFIYSTYLLETAAKQGALIVNNAQSLRDYNEKLFATQFPQCCPPTVVSSNQQCLIDFHRLHTDTIFKPLDGMGGSSIFHVKEHDKNLNVIIETLTDNGQCQIMAQRYLPEITQGDKRILMINGEPVDYCLARIPIATDHRANLAAGGKGRVQPLTERDRWIANEIGPTLKQQGLYFVGLDVIGDYLTEINVTSPTGLREIQAQTDINIGEQLFQCIEQQLEKII